MMAVKKCFDRILSYLDEWLFPENVLCLCCDRALGEEAQDGVCCACAKALERLYAMQEEREADSAQTPDGLAFVHSAYPYEGQVRTLVHAMKYRSIRAAALPLARPMAMLSSGEEEIIVPVPTDKGRRRKRGFNQATLLAQHIATELGMPMCEALVRVRRCVPQTGLSEEKRRVNLIGCMAVSPRHRKAVDGKSILLVDDVYTTGATIMEAARALREAGAVSVGVFTAARAGQTDCRENPAFLTGMWQKNHGIHDKNHRDL